MFLARVFFSSTRRIFCASKHQQAESFVCKNQVNEWKCKATRRMKIRKVKFSAMVNRFSSLFFFFSNVSFHDRILISIRFKISCTCSFDHWYEHRWLWCEPQKKEENRSESRLITFFPFQPSPSLLFAFDLFCLRLSSLNV